MADVGRAGGGPEGTPRSRSRDVRLVAMGVVAVLLVWFALGNLQDVEVHFWVHTAHTSLFLVVLISGILGSLITLLVLRRRGSSRS